MRASFVLPLLVVVLLPNLRGFAAPPEATAPVVVPSNGTVAQAQDKTNSPGVPFVYRQVGYLASVGPAPLRFDDPSPERGKRTPPRVASSKKPELSITAEAMARTEAIEAYRSLFRGKIPVPPGSAESGVPASNPFFDSGTSGTNPNEVLEFFQQPPQDPDAQKRQNRFLFDPIFQSAQPPAQSATPQSRATYRQN